METTDLSEIRTALPYFLKHKTVWSSYDSEADVFYLHFKKPNHADDSQITDGEIIVHYGNKEVIGMAILNASQQIKSTIL